MKIADIVISINGRDAGKRFYVIGTENEYSLIADGKGRRLEKPKRKKNKHLQLDSRASGALAEKLIKGEKITNNELRRALAEYAETKSGEETKTAQQPTAKQAAANSKEGGAPKCQKTT